MEPTISETALSHEKKRIQQNMYISAPDGDADISSGNNTCFKKEVEDGQNVNETTISDQSKEHNSKKNGGSADDVSDPGDISSGNKICLEGNETTISVPENMLSHEVRIKKRRNSSPIDGSNCDPDDTSLCKKSCFGGDSSLSSVSDTYTQVDAEVSQLQRKEKEKAWSTRLDTEVADSKVSCHSNPNCEGDSSSASEDRLSDTTSHSRSSKMHDETSSKCGEHSVSPVNAICESDKAGSSSSLRVEESIQPCQKENIKTIDRTSKHQFVSTDNDPKSRIESSCPSTGVLQDISTTTILMSSEDPSLVPGSAENTTIIASIHDLPKDAHVVNLVKEHLDDESGSRVNDITNVIPAEVSAKMSQSTVSSQEEISYVVKLPSLILKAVGLSRRKLLILDVNGLLADIIPYPARGYEPDTWIAMKAVFKRPFCDDFLHFCFETFNVGIWSSRNRRNVESVVNFLMGHKRNRLLFCWNQEHCTKTGYNTVDNRSKPLFLKEIKKLWDKEEPDLPWKKGEYNESNTLLIDDSPYKALRNPQYTGIFPYPFEYKDINDKSLGPNGNLRLYLQKLAVAENVQKFVEENPTGQRPITKSNLSWAFYSKIFNATGSSEPQKKDDGRSDEQQRDVIQEPVHKSSASEVATSSAKAKDVTKLSSLNVARR